MSTTLRTNQNSTREAAGNTSVSATVSDHDRYSTSGSAAGSVSISAAATARSANSTFTFSTIQSLSKYNELEQYFEIQRVENEAARVIQLCWRRTRVLLPWRRAVHCLKMVQRIQRVARGAMTRQWVAQWFHKRNTTVVAWQARTRRYLSNLHLQPRLKREWLMAIEIQRILRGFLARLNYVQLVHDLMATRIQVMWRGVVGRLRTDKLWLHSTVIPIQSLYRKRMAVKRYFTVLAEAKAAAVVIQKCFRNWASRQRIGDRLFNREMDYRFRIIKMLTSEEEYLTERLEKAMARLIKSDYKGKAQRAFKALKDLEGDVYLKENDLIEMRRQQEILSPRARAQGFEEELLKNVKQLRGELTDMKAEHLFTQQVRVHKQDELFESHVTELEEYALQRDRIAQFRNQEYEERRHLTYKREITQRRRQRRQAVAEEKRRWRVLHYTSDGKPDKRRRPGMPWDPSLLAGPEKNVYSAGSGVNLLANVIPSGKEGQRAGTVQSVDRTLSMVSLQTYLDQVRVYEQLLQPIENVMKATMGGMGSMLPTAAISGGEAVAASATGCRPGTADSLHVLRSKAPQNPPLDLSQRGFGPIGSAIIPALQTIGALPPDDELEEQRNTEILMRKPQPTALQKIRGLDGKLISDPRKNQKQKKSDLTPIVHSSSNNNMRKSQSSGDYRRSDLMGAGYDDDVAVKAVVVHEPPPPTAAEIFEAYRRKKKASRRSYLPALDAFSLHEKPKKRQSLSIVDSKIAAAVSASVMEGMYDDADDAFSVASSVPGFGGLQRGTGGRDGYRQQKIGLREEEIAAAAASTAAVEQQTHALVVRADQTLQAATSRAERVVARSAAAEAARLKQIQEDRAARAAALLFNAGIVVDNKQQQLDGDESVEPEYWRDVHQTRKQREAERAQQLFENRRKAKQVNRRTGTIPWELLDQMDGARKRFESEKAYVEFNLKF